MALDWQKFQDTIKAAAQMMDAYAKGKQQAQQRGGPLTPGRVGPLLPPTHVTFDTRGAGGQMTVPNEQPLSMPYSPSPGGAQLAAKLSPSGAAAYSGIQGVAQFLTQWNQRREAKTHSEAANIAQNLMHAIQTGDTATAHEIMTDPKAVKVLNKVYKGWLTPEKEGKKKGSPEQAGFEAGLQKSIQQYLAGKSSQPPAMPHAMGGYIMPSIGPAGLNQAAALNAELQANRQNPARMLGVAPREKVAIGEKMAELGWGAGLQKTIASGYYQLLKTQATQEGMLRRMLMKAGLDQNTKERLQNLEDQAKKDRLNLQYGLRKSLADHILKGKPDQGSKIAYQAMKELLDNATRQKTSYVSLLKSSKDDTTTKFANQQIQILDQQIQGYQTQMQQLKDQDIVNKVLPLIFGGDSGGTQ